MKPLLSHQRHFGKLALLCAIAFILTFLALCGYGATPQLSLLPPPMPPVVKHRAVLRSPKAVSLLSRPKLVVRKNQGMRLAKPLTVTPGQPYFTSITNSFDDFSHQHIVTMEIAGIIGGHSYVVERSPNFTNWVFIGSTDCGAGDCSPWTVSYPELSAFGNRMFFRVRDVTQAATNPQLPPGYPAVPVSTWPTNRPNVWITLSNEAIVYHWNSNQSYNVQVFDSNTWRTVPGVTLLPNGEAYAQDASENYGKKIRLVGAQ